MEYIELSKQNENLSQEIDKLNNKIANMELLLEAINNNLVNNKNNSISLADTKHTENVKFYTDAIGKMLLIWSGEEIIVEGALKLFNLGTSLFGLQQVTMNPLVKPIVKTILTIAMAAYGHENISKDFIVAFRDTVIDITFQVKKDIFDPIYEDLSTYNDYIKDSYDNIYDHTIKPVGDLFSDLTSYIY